MDLLESLVILSEKAARIARLIRKDEHLFQLLIQQKNSDEANPRFVKDFKTLADVLIQQMIKHFLELQFPGIADRVRGEENNTFCNTLGDKITVEIKETPEETGDSLAKIMNGDEKAASLLAEEVHRSINMKDVNTKKIEGDCPLDVNNVGIWIDPIDSTAEYINASNETYENNESGLQCVTILIGVYDIKSGDPVIGVINQPFLKLNNDCWSGECIWGICYNSIRLNSLDNSTDRCYYAYTSSSDDAKVKLHLEYGGYGVKEAPGAGNKLLKVIKNDAACYVLSKGTTYKWDTCGPQAILRSLGGNIADYSKAAQNSKVFLKYPHDVDCEDGTCNKGGVVAFRQPEILEDCLDAISY